MSFRLDGGALKPLSDPITEPAQQRLHNLGYGSTNVSDKRTTLSSIKGFQQDYKLKVSGTVDSQTKDKIRELHGS